MTAWYYPVYALLLVVVVFLSIKLADLVDELDKRTKISGAFIGGVLLAAVTSLPELFTAISSILFVHNPSLVIGDILGSDIFDLLVLCVYTVFFFKTFRHSKQDKFNFVSLLALVIFYSLTAYAIFVPKEKQIMLGSINLMSIIIFIGYIVLLVIQPKNSEEEKEEVIENNDKQMSIKMILILFVILSIILIVASIFIAILTDKITDELTWLNGTVGGAILLGVATSLPEVISTFALFKKKNFNAGFSNMIGSCTFNFSILALADFISWKDCDIDGTMFMSTERGIYFNSMSAKWLTLFGLVVILMTTLIMVFVNLTKFYEKKPKASFIVNTILAAIATSAYVFSLIL